jgi:hypothetical protein
MATTDVLEKRLTDLETIVWDLPGLLTTRTAKYEAEFTSIRDRLDKIERNQGMLQVDMRDLRNGVARFMAEFDARMRALEEATTEGLRSLEEKTTEGLRSLEEKTAEGLRSLEKTTAKSAAASDARLRGLEETVTKLGEATALDRAEHRERFEKVDTSLTEILRRLPKA